MHGSGRVVAGGVDHIMGGHARHARQEIGMVEMQGCARVVAGGVDRGRRRGCCARLGRAEAAGADLHERCRSEEVVTPRDRQDMGPGAGGPGLRL